MKIKPLLIVLFTLSLIVKNATAGFISEIAIDYKRQYNGYFDLCSDGIWSNGAGISLGTELRKDKLYLFSGFNYLPTSFCNTGQIAKYIQLPLELRFYFFRRIIFIETGLDVRWMTNYYDGDWKEEYRENFKPFTPGINLAFGVQQNIKNNLFLNIKAFISNGFYPEPRTADPTNCGVEFELAFAFN